MTLRFEIPGPPVAKARARTVRTGAGPRSFTPKETVDFENRVRFAAQAAGARPLEGPVQLVVIAYFPCPKSRHRKRVPRPEEPRAQKPDWDNVGKAVSDALNGIAYTDDSQVSDAVVRKRTAAQGEAGRTVVMVREVGGRVQEDKTTTTRQEVHNGLHSKPGRR